MRPEYYADLYRRYQTFVRQYSDQKIYKIAGGANVDDYNWIEVLMKNASRFMDGLSLHYYTIPGDFCRGKGSATVFDEDEWFITMKKAFYMDELITRHSHLMDQYDPEKRVGLSIDELGTWFDPETGTNPGFLYQQNTIRDALVAAFHFNVFHQHSDRVHMANIAQMVNVLQAMILTKGEKMILTPTYHVFDMFKVNHDAKLLAVESHVEQYQWNEETLPKISVSATKDQENRIHINLCHIDLQDTIELTIDVRGMSIQEAGPIKGTILTANEKNAHNTFDHPENVKPDSFHDFAWNEKYFKIPPMSVAVL